MRIYNPALGKFLSVDPITAQYPELTPYQFASNRPIDGIDLDGKEYVESSIADNKFFSQLGITFADDVEKQTFIQSHTVVDKGVSYLNLGYHVYQDKDGNYSTKESDGSTRVSKWVYTEIKLLKEDSRILTWETTDKAASGSQTFTDKSGKTHTVDNNKNCVYV